MAIIDQYSDKGQYVLINILEAKDSSEVVKTASNLFNNVGDVTKLGSEKFAWSDFRKFPVDTQDNTILSKLYFDYQKEDIPKAYVSKIASKLDTYLDLHNVPLDIFTQSPKLIKTAQVEGKYLLPKLSLCKVASTSDLEKASSVFSTEHRKLEVPDRVEFAKNFMKCADEFRFKGNISTYIIKYAALMDSSVADLTNLLSLRVAAANRVGKSGVEYTKLANAIKDVEDPVITDRESLEKLADLILDLDKQHGFDQPKYDKTMPCAYGVVFNKEATDSSKETVGDGELEVSKSEIVGKYGHGILEEVENSDGTIDGPKLQNITKKLNLTEPKQG